jgi:sugar lactone lactonase YvrE
MLEIMNANPIAVDLQNIYISNYDAYRAEDDPELNHAILKLGTDSNVRLLAGKTETGFQDGPANQATFHSLTDVISYRGTLYVLDKGNRAIRKVDAQGNVTTFASSTEGRGFKAPLSRIESFTIDSAGTIYVSDRDPGGSHVIKITSTGEVTVFRHLLNYFAYSIVVDDSGFLYSTSPAKHCIYRAKLGVDDKATVFVGNEQEPGMVDATGTESRFNQPWGLVLGSDGNVYAADFDNHSIRKVTPEGVVTTLAGDGNGRNIDGLGMEASFYYPMYLAWHPRDMILYVLEGDDEDLAIRSVDADTGAVATVYPNPDLARPPTPAPAPAGPPAFITPPDSPPSKDIEAGSGDVIAYDDIEEGSVVGQIVGEGGTIAIKSYYFPDTLRNLWSQGPSKFIDPTTRKKIVDVKWYKAHLVPEGTLGGRKKTRKSKKSKRKTFRKNRKQSNKKRKY